MLNVLLVDDEPYIREGLKVLIDWEKFDYHVAGEAKNAFEAIEILKKQSFDLIFIDIRMPKMNGIELANYIRKQVSTSVYIVFLTGYLDIDYVNSAFKLNAVQYIQKPVQPEQLEEILKVVRAKKEQQRNEEKFNKKSRKDLREYYLLELLHGTKNQDNISYLQMLFRGERTFYYIHFQFYAKQEQSKEDTVHYVSSIKNRIKTDLKEKSFYVITNIGSQQEYAMGLITTGQFLQERKESIYEYVDEVLEELNEISNLKIVVRIGKQVDDISKINESYIDSMNAIPYMLKSKEIPLELRLRSYLEAHYMDNITLKSLSEKFYVNTAYLGQFFKKHNGVFLKDYLNSIRVKKAQELLKNTSLKIYQVAENVGFQSADSFITAFSKETGLTPQKYRLSKENNEQ